MSNFCCLYRWGLPPNAKRIHTHWRRDGFLAGVLKYLIGRYSTSRLFLSAPSMRIKSTRRFSAQLSSAQPFRQKAPGCIVHMYDVCRYNTEFRTNELGKTIFRASTYWYKFRYVLLCSYAYVVNFILCS